MSSRADRIRGLAAEIAPACVELRRQVHRRPELGWHEVETTYRVANALRSLGIEPHIRDAGTGIVAQIGDRGPVVGFRSDLDALPIDEETDVPFRSEVRGVMHACGHDAHTAIGVGIGAVLSRLGDLPGRARLVFQPAEETIPGGAVELSAEGVSDGLEAIIAYHVDPSLPAGRVGVRTGPVTGASDRVVIELTGPGGHTSRPHRTVDLVYAAARVAADLPVLLQRTTDPRHPVILAFGRIAGGSAANVIPSRVELAGTVRLFDLELWRTMEPTVVRLVQDLVDPLGAIAKVEYERGSPPVLNDGRVIDIATRAATRMLGDNGVAETYQSMGSEDFAWYLEHAPGALIRLGSAVPGVEVDLHSSTFDLDERCIEEGIATAVEMIVSLMEQAG